MRLPASRRHAATALVGLAVLVLGATLLVGGTGRRTGGAAAAGAQPARSGETGAASPAAARLPQPSAEGDVVLLDDADGLTVRLRLRNPGPVPVVVTGVEELPSGLTAAPLPDGGVRIAPTGTADLLLRWAGPACTAEVPDRFLPEVALAVLHGDLSTPVTVATPGAEQTLRDAWRAACDGSGRLG